MRLILALVMFFMAGPFALAKDPDAQLKQEYGSDLTHAPFFIRNAFYNDVRIDWEKSDYYQRRIFLENYETQAKAEQVEEKQEATDEASAEKQHRAEKKAELTRERDRLKAELAEESAEKQADEERQRDFNNTLRAQEQELQQMQEQLSEEREANH